ncbi:hypothetical protein [Streptomyces sp. GbtcB6]|uniref:hypothetical protein n=1 Tax=Streptomyces sp. GbtcB6 TaxID=2824751 RepID=UPI001C302F21|nr:hypothetical protein [Streptomyces sp. GbtcB6]
MYFTLPKGGKTRVVDMSPSIASALAEYFLEYPAVEVELPYGNAIRANIFNVEVWKPALAAAGVIPARNAAERWKATRKDGFHVLRHTYASVILETGESVVTLARWLHSRGRRKGARCHRRTPQPKRPGRPGRVVGTLLGRLREAGRSICCAPLRRSGPEVRLPSVMFGVRR